MKKIFIGIILMYCLSINTYAQSVQLTDYNYTYGRRMLDGYNYVEYSAAFKYKSDTHGAVETNILKNDGTELFVPAEYDVQYGYGEHGSYKTPESTMYWSYIYPQSYDGKYFVVRTNRGKALLNTDGQVVLDSEVIDFPSVPFMPGNYYYFKYPNHDREGTYTAGIFDSTTKKRFTITEKTPTTDIGMKYYNAKKDEFAIVYIINEKLPETAKITLEIYNKTVLIKTYDMEVKMNRQDHSFSNDVISGDYDSIIFDGEEYIWLPVYTGVTINEDVPKPDFLKINRKTEESESERVDRSYTFKEKEINGVKYYALFKELKDGETAADFAPTERPYEQYAENIDKMAADKLLYNNELCFFDKGITKLDFGIVLGRAYSKTMVYNVGNYTPKAHFADVNNPYCVFLADKGILGSDNDFYINEKTISQREIFNELNKIAVHNRVFSEWRKVREVRDTDDECSRELAYSEIYKLYGLLQNPDTPKDFNEVIYITIGSLLILFVGAFINDKLKTESGKIMDILNYDLFQER